MLFTSLKLILKRSFTWWNGQTWGTWLFTRRYGKSVGTDSHGNQYFETANKSRRWVIYPHYSEASSIPPDWHAWLHKIIDVPPSQEPLQGKKWEKIHSENLTGTSNAYIPPSSLCNLNIQSRRKAVGDYEAWTPNK